MSQRNPLSVDKSRQRWSEKLEAEGRCRRCALRRVKPGSKYCEPCLSFKAARGRQANHRNPEYGAVFTKAVVSRSLALQARGLE